ncbi:phospholipase [Micromonospora sp. NBC_01655]|uniref:alpha/beta hydrolase n=1 Tax=Micromonospora sp. NBC_01655 TaxID=2975983 RepID=UPI0022562FC6|nr:phospholipase [Micromonospora sp. NBC_01655]MCX4472027.1 phospholipase [Micromonospora sp. NBC_01655]
MTEPALPHREPAQDHRHGRLAARPAPPTGRARRGLTPVTGPGGEPRALVYAPDDADERPYRLVLLLHGAGGSARQGLDLLLPLADAHHLLLVAPQATASTWDLIAEGFGPDVRRIDELLESVLSAHPVADVAFGGFSDGASYALSLGLTNGDLVRAVLAFSPGFAAPLVTRGRPRVFVSHGAADPVLPADMCSRRLVPRLRALGYPVDYAEFTGGHEVPAELRRRAADWLAAAPASGPA